MNREKLFLELYQELMNGKSIEEICKDYKKFTKEELEELTEFCMAVRQQLLNQAYFKLPGELDGELLLTNLLMGVRVNGQLVVQKLFSAAGIREQYYCLYVFEQNSTKGQKNFAKLHKAIEKKIPLSIGVYFKKYTVILRCLKNIGSQLEAPDLLEFMQSQNLHCGISNTFSDINQSEFYFIQAQNALAYASYLPTEQPVARYEDYIFFHMLEYVNEKCDLNVFLNRGIVRLLAYDKEYKTNYFKDIVIYYQCGEDVRLTAKMLGVHRNTVHYRISKIESIIGGALADPVIGFHLRISIQILCFLKGKEFYSEFDISGAKL